MTERAFPTNFVWGVATSGHQTEGDNVDSDTWFLEQQTPSIFQEPSGKACNSWERWEDDVGLVADLGLNAYRYSVEWARIEPRPGEFSDEAIDHYTALTARCVELGIQPVVTFSHFTSPHWFAMRGSWLDADAPDAFARFCGRVMEAFGDHIAHAVTLNEPNLHRMLAWANLPAFVAELERATLGAATAAAGVERYRAGNVMLVEEFPAMQDGLTAAHRAAKAAIKSYRDDLPVGLSLAMVDDQVVGDDPSVRDRKRADVYDHWLQVSSEDDFIGVQNYERLWYDGNGAVEPAPGLSLNQMGSSVEPASLGGAVRYAYERAGVPVLVTEHGISTDDDPLRADFIPRALSGLLNAIEDGIPVIGYIHWTLLDNFEWIFGFDKQLGIASVDRTTFARTPKPSAEVYGQIARTNTIEL